jgi:lysophospholipase L1-like esterase
MDKARTAKRPKGRRDPRAFTLILFVLPWLILAGIEGILRLSGVARPPSFYLHREVAGRGWLQIHPSLGDRFFTPALRGIVPSPNFQVLPAEKPADAKRILCIGESTTAGFPFPVTGGFPALLQGILQEADPSTRWEVINCGMTGISSSSVAAVIDEMLAAHPDYLVVYLGHNEFYGAGGARSPGLGLRNLRIVRLMERLFSRRAQEKQPGTLMERIAARASIPARSPLRTAAYRRYEHRIDQILDAAERKGTRVILCELVSNEKDLYPFGTSKADAARAAHDPSQWTEDRPLPSAAGAIATAITQRLAQDSLNAGLYYLRGVARVAAGDAEGARDFVLARNLDAVPFRAPDPINAILRRTAARRHVPLVPTEKLFRAASPAGVPGRESFVEHLHPTFLGNARIAAAVSGEILGRAASPVTIADAARWLKGSALTRLDLSFADARVAQLLRRWPYEREGEDAPPFAYRARSVREEAVTILSAAGDSAGATYMSVHDPEEESLTQALLAKRIDLLAAHTKLARYRAGRNELYPAAREYAAATALYPVDPALWIEYGEILLRVGDRRGAGSAAQQAQFWSPGDGRASDLLRRATGR